MTQEQTKDTSDIVIRIGRPQARVLSLLLVLAAVYNGQQHVGDFFSGVFEGYEQGQARHPHAQGGFVDAAIDSYNKTQEAHR